MSTFAKNPNILPVLHVECSDIPGYLCWHTVNIGGAIGYVYIA